ncbi:MAG: hypothetical protein WD036_02480, partial [Bauldia sp.]
MRSPGSRRWNRPDSSPVLADLLNPRLRPRLRPATQARTKARLAELGAAAKAAGVAELDKVLRQPNVGPFLAAVMDCSPFLRSLILDDPARLAAILASDPAARLKRIAAGT